MTRRVARCALFLVLSSCSRSDRAEPPATTAPAASTAPIAPARAADPAAARRLIDAGAPVIDVRTPEEFAEGHVARAVNIPVQQLDARLGEVAQLVGGDRSRPIVVYCAAGGRAGRAKAALEAAGYAAVVNGGGYDDLQ